MKRIEFIAPVEAMRGNLSGRQKLVYAKNDNPAFSAPEGVNYARNYKPRFIGAKKAKTGMTYFATRTKHAAVNNARTQAAQGAIAAARNAYYEAIKDLSILNNLQALYNVSAAKANGESKYKWFVDKAIPCYRQMGIAFGFSGRVGSSTVSVTIDNVFRNGTTGTPLALDEEIRVKFWDALAYQGFSFKVGESVGIAFEGQNFEDILDNNVLNVLGLTAETVSSESYIKMGGLYLQLVDHTTPTDPPTYVKGDDQIQETDDDLEYILTNTAPA